MKIGEVTINNTVCDVSRTCYEGGRTAVILTVKDTGEPYATLSSNFPDAPFQLTSDEFFVKLYSENEGLKVPCLASGLFEEVIPIGHFSGFCTYPIWRIKKR